jgi:hypothetical protein
MAILLKGLEYLGYFPENLQQVTNISEMLMSPVWTLADFHGIERILTTVICAMRISAIAHLADRTSVAQIFALR